MLTTLRNDIDFTESEKYGLVGVALFLGFMFSFGSGGTTTPHVTEGIIILLVTMLMALGSVAIRLLGQKLTALFLGYRVHWTMELRGLLCTLLLWFLSGGYAILPLYGGISIDPIQELRFGKKPGFKFYHLGWISAMGSITSLIVVLLLRLVWAIIPSESITHLALMNGVIAVVMALPVPWADGLHLFFASRLDYVAYFSTLLFVSLSLLLFWNENVIWLLIPTIIVACTTWGIYWRVEKNIK